MDQLFLQQKQIQTIETSLEDKQDQNHLLQDREPITTDQFKSKKHI